MVQNAKLLRILLSATDRYMGAPAYEAIANKCMALGIAGATVVKGIEGFGDTAEMHRTRAIKGDEPIAVTIVDTSENIERLLPELEQIAGDALIAISNVTMRRIER